jgi:prophage regulatory protein
MGISLLRLPEVIKRCGVSKAKLYLMINEGHFPRPLKNGSSSVWPSNCVDEWVDNFITSQMKAS